MHCETLLRLSIEEVNFTSVRKTNIALSVKSTVLKAKQLQWTTTVDPPQQNWKNISGGLAQWTGGRTLP